MPAWAFSTHPKAHRVHQVGARRPRQLRPGVQERAPPRLACAARVRGGRGGLQAQDGVGGRGAVEGAAVRRRLAQQVAARWTGASIIKSRRQQPLKVLAVCRGAQAASFLVRDKDAAVKRRFART